MPVNVSVTAEDWQVLANKKAAELLQMEANLQAAARTVSELAERIAELEKANAAHEEEGKENTPSRNGTGKTPDGKTTRPVRSGRRRKQSQAKG